MVVVNVVNELLIELPLFKLMLLGIIHLKIKMENQYRSFFFIQLVFRQYNWVKDIPNPVVAWLRCGWLSRCGPTRPERWMTHIERQFISRLSQIHL
jgi:hypothetical protein